MTTPRGSSSRRPAARPAFLMCRTVMAMLFCRANVAPRVTLDTFLAQVLAQIASVRERTRWYGRCLERRLRSPVSPRNGRSERRNPLPEQGVSLRSGRPDSNRRPSPWQGAASVVCRTTNAQVSSGIGPPTGHLWHNFWHRRRQSTDPYLCIPSYPAPSATSPDGDQKEPTHRS